MTKYNRSILILFCLWISLISICGASFTYARDQKPGEYQVKAAFIYHFIRFVEWPDKIVSHNSSPFNICILGEDPFGNSFNLLRGETVNNSNLTVKRIRTIQNPDECKIVFIGRSEAERLPYILKVLKGLNVLTIGDTAGFARQGVIINFHMEENKVRFNINIDAARRSGLKISSKLLNLATIVHDTQNR
jgi:hypothetical protein